MIVSDGMEQGLGYVPDPEDPRDLSVEVDLQEVLGAAQPPASYDGMLGHFCTILSQGPSESCCGTSTGGAFRAWWSCHGKPARLPSPLWLWTLGRKTHGAERLNTGTFLRAVLKAAFNLGFCPEETWPSDDMARDFAKDPSEDQRVFRDAFDQKGFGYYRVTGLDDQRILSVKRTLHADCPILFGTGVSREFLRLGLHEKPVGPPSIADVVGGHAMYWLAYDEGGVRGVNSHGIDFGNGGLFYMSWEYVVWLMTRDIWAISWARPF